MTSLPSLVVLLDLDNTLIDNDRVKHETGALIETLGGELARHRFWEIYEAVRHELGTVSIPVTIARFAHEYPDTTIAARVTDFLLRYPYRQRLFEGVPAVLRHLRRFGPLVIVSDGEPWYQMKKIVASGLDRAVGGNALIFPRKEQYIEQVLRWYPAERYLFIDDKPRLLTAVKSLLGTRITTVWVRQGAYARRGWDHAGPAADIILEHIAHARTLGPAQTGAAPGTPWGISGRVAGMGQ